MSKRNCSVYGCSNTEKNTKQSDPPVKFYCFPGRPWQAEQKQKWISFVKRKQKDGSPRIPTKNSRICSEHFAGGRKSEHPHHPSFFPTILKKSHRLDDKGKVSRYERYSKRNDVERRKDSVDVETESHEIIDSPEAGISQQDKGTQVHMQNSTETMQTHPPSVWARYLTPCFQGIDSIHKDGDLRNLTGVSRKLFELLLNLLPATPPNILSLNNENKLLMTLMKLKCGNALSFKFLAIIYGTSDKSISRIFQSVVSSLHVATKACIFFPSREAVNETRPTVFKEKYGNCRVIIDCTEIRTQTPGKVDQRIHMYSNYKGGFTIKYLIGITPSGFVSFISKGYGGRATDSYITNHCGILNLIESGDSIMADKGFPHVNTIDGVIVVMPPFSKGESVQFANHEVEQTYSIASVRIHVERMIQRVKAFQILSTTVPITLLPIMDKIVHLCCVIVNLSEPIIKS